MASIDIAPVPAADTARAEGVWSKIRYYAASHPLGVVGAVIMLVFVFAAVFADFITAYDPIKTNSLITLARPSDAHWLGADQMGRDIYSRIVYGARISLAVGLGSTSLGCFFGVILGLTSGLSRRLGRPRHPAHCRRAAGGAALGAGAGDGGGAGSCARQYHRRHRHPAHPLHGARRTLQHADAARTAIRRSRARRRHERIPHRGAPCAAQYAGAVDRDRHRAARRRHP